MINAQTGKLYYHVHWSRVSRKTDDGWISGYGPVTGEQVKELPEVFKHDTLEGGWEDLENGSPVKPITYPNPIPKDKRK